MLSTLCGIHPENVPLDFFRRNEIVLICVVDRSRATWTRRLSATKISSEQHVSGKSGHIKDIGKLKVTGFLKYLQYFISFLFAIYLILTIIVCQKLQKNVYMPLKIAKYIWKINNINNIINPLRQCIPCIQCIHACIQCMQSKTHAISKIWRKRHTILQKKMGKHKQFQSDGLFKIFRIKRKCINFPRHRKIKFS